MTAVSNGSMNRVYDMSLSKLNDGMLNQFKLSEEFINKYKDKKPHFGFNGLGEFVFYRTYSRIKKDGTKESFTDTLRRVVEGCYEIQRRHCKKIHVPWDYQKASASAEEMFERMWQFKFLPPGRGLWMMGTDFMWERGSASLNNCGFVSTKDIAEDPAEPFVFMMDMSMLGVGVGFDTKGAGKLTIGVPAPIKTRYEVPDSREGWCNSVGLLIQSFTNDQSIGIIEFDYSMIRQEGTHIKGFGGKASGPGILMKLHSRIRDFLTDRIGKTLTSTDIVDLMNFIGQCVVAGNVRRSAQITFGEPDDYGYVSMKNPTHALNQEDRVIFNRIRGELFARGCWIDGSAAAVEDFLELSADREVIRDAVNILNASVTHRWASNNSIFGYIGMDYQKIGEQIMLNGEPGLIWLDNIRDYGRFIDGKKPGIDGRVMGTNPCFSGEMKLLTATGYKDLRQLWQDGGCKEFDGLGNNPLDRYGSIDVVNLNGIVASTNVYRTSECADLYEVTLANGSSIIATSLHDFFVFKDSSLKNMRDAEDSVDKVKLQDLIIGKEGSQLPLFDGRDSINGNIDYPEYARLAGWVIGDGTVAVTSSKTGVVANVPSWNEDIETALPKLREDMIAVYNRSNLSTNQNPSYTGWSREQEHFDYDQKTFRSMVLGRLLSEDGVKPGDKHNIPKSIWNSNAKTIAAFLSGFASADGGVQVNDNKKCISIRIGQSNKQLLAECQKLFGLFGITSTIRKVEDASKQLMNDGKGGRKLYNRKASFELIISGLNNCKRFISQIGFIQDWKNEIANLWFDNHKGSNNSETKYKSFVKSIKYIGKGETFCLTEPKNNQIVVNGVVVSQCSEQSLESYELCNLVETFPANHDDAEDYHRTLKFAYLYAKTVTLLPTHNARTNSVTLRNRRIGLSQSGIVQAFAKFGRRSVLSDFCDAGYVEVKGWDKIYSEWLCVPPSIKVTSVKPSGTVSLVAGATPGIHYPEATTYWRRVRVSKNSSLVKIYRDAGYEVEQAVSDPETVVIKFAVCDERVRPVDQVSIWEQMANAVDYNRYWADNQVSCTIKFKREEAKEIAKVLETYEDQLKGISFLPISDHGYEQAPYEACTPEEAINYINSLSPTVFDAYINEDAIGSHGCDNDVCTLP